MLKSALFKESLIAVVFSATGKVLALLVTLYLAKVLAQGDFGAFSYARNMILMLGPMFALGYTPSSSRFIPQYLAREEYGKARGFFSHAQKVVFAFSTVASGVAALVIIFGGDLIPQDYRSICLIVLVACPFYSLAFFLSTATRAAGSLIGSLLPIWILQPLALIFGAWLFATQLGWVNDRAGLGVLFVAATVSTSLLAVLWARLRLSPKLRAAVREYDVRTWMSVALPLALSVAATNFVARFPAAAAGAAVGAKNFAIYAVSYMMAQTIQLALQPMTWVFVPRISRAIGAGRLEDARRLTILGTVAALTLGGLGFLVLVVAGRFALGFVSPAYADGYNLMLVLAVEQWMLTASATLGPVLNVSGRHWHAVVLMVVRAAVLFVAVLVVLPQYGMVGVATTSAVVSGLWVIASAISGLRALSRRAAEDKDRKE
ncbi:MAG: oligosaccharide flippase family protein [Rhodobiaceae bacterium]|nr:oligosaccharide flippase family protein [Rhodobiaceae bacterium]